MAHMCRHARRRIIDSLRMVALADAASGGAPDTGAAFGGAEWLVREWIDWRGAACNHRFVLRALADCERFVCDDELMSLVGLCGSLIRKVVTTQLRTKAAVNTHTHTHTHRRHDTYRTAPIRPRAVRCPLWPRSRVGLRTAGL